MRDTISRSLAIFGLLAFTTQNCAAQSAQNPVQAAPADPPEFILQHLRGSQEEFIANVMKPLRGYGERRDSIDAKDVEYLSAAEDAQMRAQFMVRLLSRDMDADGRLSIDELRNPPTAALRVPGARDRTRDKKAIRKDMTADADGDGFLSFPEILEASKKYRHQTLRTASNQLHQMLALDPDGDGVLTAVELENIARAAFKQFDVNGNGWIDTPEASDIADLRKKQKQRQASIPTTDQIENCDLPEAGEKDQVVVLGTYEGHAVSSVSVAGLDDETSTGTIAIEKGDTPIYLVATAFEKFIWNVTGDVSRLSRLVIIPTRVKTGPGAGVVGVPKDKITFLESGSCFRFFTSSKAGAGTIAKATVGRVLERDDVTAIGTYTISNMPIPSGSQPKAAERGTVILLEGTKRFELTSEGVKELPRPNPTGPQPPSGVDPGTWSELYRFNPGGVVKYDPAAVISPGEVLEYDVLPEQAGLVQLMEQGAIRRLPDGYYLIEKPIARYPAGLSGAHSVKFMLGKNVPEPAGSPGHSCVRSEETGKIITRGAGRC